MNQRLCALLLTAIVGLFAAMPGVRAASVVWDFGGANASWNTAANWNPDGLPSSGNAYTLGIASGAATTLDANFALQQLTYSYGGAGSLSGGTGTYTLTLNNGVGGTVLSNAPGGTTTFTINNTVNLALGANSAISVNGTAPPAATRFWPSTATFPGPGSASRRPAWAISGSVARTPTTAAPPSAPADCA